MSELMIYLLKANIALTLFYLGYYFGLRNLTFYRLNRYYLLLALTFSVTYPLINLKSLFSSRLDIPAEIITALPDLNNLHFSQQGMEFSEIIEYFLWFSFAVVFFNLLIKLRGVLKVHVNSIPAHWNIYPYRKSQEDITPFSFWKSIYLNPDKHNKEEFDKIFKHEYIHVRQLHSLDTLTAELVFVFFWYNPICWFIRQSIHENIEFITDQKVLSTGINKQSYQYSLLNISSLPTEPALGNHFNIKNLKKRIKMMNKNQTSNSHLSKYVFILPIVIIGSLIFSITNAKESLDSSPLSTSIITNERMAEEQNSLLPNTEPAKGRLPENLLILVNGVKVNEEDFKKINPKDIESINVYKEESAIERFGKEATDGVIEIFTKANKK